MISFRSGIRRFASQSYRVIEGVRDGAPVRVARGPKLPLGGRASELPVVAGVSARHQKLDAGDAAALIDLEPDRDVPAAQTGRRHRRNQHRDRLRGTNRATLAAARAGAGARARTGTGATAAAGAGAAAGALAAAGAGTFAGAGAAAAQRDVGELCRRCLDE